MSGTYGTRTVASIILNLDETITKEEPIDQRRMPRPNNKDGGVSYDSPKAKQSEEIIRRLSHA